MAQTYDAQNPSDDFVERMKDFSPHDVKSVIRMGTAKFRPHLGNLDGERRLIFTDLQQAGRSDASHHRRIEALWRMLPFLVASDSGRGIYGVHSAWVFLTDQACEYGFIDSDDLLRFRAQHRQTFRSNGRRRRFRLRWPWRRNSNNQRRDTDWASDIGEDVGDFLASRNSGSSSGSSSGNSWWPFGGSGSGGGGSWLDF